MSIRQGSSVIAQGTIIDNTPVSGSTNAVSSGGTYTALTGKADTDLSNLTATGKIYAGHLAMPSTTITTLTLPASGSTVTAPYDGYMVFRMQTSAAYQYIEMVNITGSKYNGGFCMGPQIGSYCLVTCPCSKGDVVYVGYNAGGALDKFQFVRTNGAA